VEKSKGPMIRNICPYMPTLMPPRFFFAEVEEKLNTPKDRSKKEKNKSAENEVDIVDESEISDGEDVNGEEAEKDLEDGGSLEEGSCPADNADEESEDVLGTDEEV